MTTDDGSPGPDRSAATPGLEAAPRCYRHPDRETYLTCVRCERPICPDCMVQAAVGFQCKECVREANHGQRVARTALGGRIRPNQSVVTYTLIGINVVVFLLEQASSNFIDRFALVGGALERRGQFGVVQFIGIAHGEYYRLLTAMFLHNGITHILFNMWALFVVGPPVEAMLGRLRYTALYFLSGLTASATAYLLSPPNVAVVGASGAIFGLFGALFVLGRRLRFDIRAIGITILANLVLTFVIPNISWQGHVGGLVSGTALAAAWVYPPRGLRVPAQLASSVAVAVVMVAMVVVRTHQLVG